MFNPWVTRKGTLAKAGEGALNFERINRRMHNKSWIADNRIAVVGGRNVGDEYFGAGEEMNFVDLDFAMLGSGRARRVGLVRPVLELPVGLPDGRRWIRTGQRGVARKAAQAAGEAARRCESRAATRGTARRRRRAADARRRLADAMVVEVPVRVRRPRQGHDEEGRRKRTHVGVALVPMLEAAKSRVTVISPYFVPGEEVTARWSRAGRRPGKVRVLTNSLVANDVAAVHGGYSRYRKPLLRGGVQLWELKPRGRRRSTRACSARRVRACTPRHSRWTASRCSSAATTSTRARPG